MRASRLLGIATAAAVVAVLVAGGALVAQGWDAADNARYQHAIERAGELDAQLNADIARARLGIVTHYDDLTHTLAQVEENLASLGTSPKAIPAATVELEAYAALVHEKATRTERFKSDLAVLRNASRLLPVAVDRLALEPAVGPAERRALDHLVEAVLLLAVDPIGARAATARCALADIGVTEPGGEACAPPPGPIPVPSGPVARAVVLQSRLIVAGSAAMEENVGALMTLPVSDAVHRLHLEYLRAHDTGAARRSLLIGLLLAAAMSALVLGAATMITRLQATARALHDAGARLSTALAQLQVERDRVVELADLRSRYLAMTSHEFRTPLSLILSSTELLASYAPGASEDRRIKHLDRIDHAARSMIRMLDRVLLLGKAEAGMLEPRPRLVRVEDVAAGVIEEIRAVIGAERRLVFANETPGAEATLDTEIVSQILHNLLSNAFKYSPDDSTVRFSVRRERSSVEFVVEDEGIGIPAEDLARLYEPFHRAGNARDFKGTGLGMAIVKRSVEVLAGELQVESAVGQGTRFRVRLPQEVPWTGC